MKSRPIPTALRLLARTAGIWVVTFVVSVSVAADQRIVAIGDVHGSLDGLTSILRAAGLTNDENRWTGGDAVLVQTGDLLDRGVEVREVMDLLMKLQQEAPTTGGRVIALLGNHETMNLLGIFRDANPDVYTAFADELSEKRRTQAFKRSVKFWKRRARERGMTIDVSDEAREQWMAFYPPGYIEYAQALEPDGVYGRWLRSLPAAAVVNGSLFMHGGYGPMLEGMSVEELNRRVTAELATFDRLKAYMVEEGLALPWFSLPDLVREAEREFEAVASIENDGSSVQQYRIERARILQPLRDRNKWLLNNPEGPFWFRGAAYWEESDRGEEMARLLDGLGVERIVVGHTPQQTNRIAARFNNRVFLIDTGMLATVYAGRPSALEFNGDTATAIYPDERHILVDPTATSAPAPEPDSESTMGGAS